MSRILNWLSFIPPVKKLYWAYLDRYYWDRLGICFKCKKVTHWQTCQNCGKRFCLGHCEHYTEYPYEYSSEHFTYPVCYHCDVE